VVGSYYRHHVRLQQKPANSRECCCSRSHCDYNYPAAFSETPKGSSFAATYRWNYTQNKKNTQMSAPVTAAAPQFLVAAPSAPKSQTLTYGLVIILLTLGMLFLVNRVKSLDLRLRNTEHLVRDLVTEDDVSELWGNFLKDKAGSLLWSEADIRAMIDEHVVDAMSACAAANQCCAASCPASAPVEAPQSTAAPTPATAPSSS